ncbi:Lrp/AsnC ligand binding domain-containing protein [Candidatus Hodarchaeum mangrovi]
MVDAVILINVIPGEEQRIKQELLKIDEIKNCRITFGEYDLVAEVNNLDKIRSLGSIMTRKIRQIPGVTKSVTLIISESLENDNSHINTTN